MSTPKQEDSPERLRQKFKHLLKLPSLWTRSYFAAVQRPTADVVQMFIQAQPKT
jgi:hypothetical protein